MKTTEELNAIKSECEDMKAKLAELTDDELEQVLGGVNDPAAVINNIDFNEVIKWHHDVLDYMFS